MNLAYSSNAYMRFPIHEAIARIAALGFRGLELMFDTPHAWPEDVTDRDVEAIRTALDHHHLTIANVNAFMMNKIGDPRQPYWHPSWIEPVRGYRRLRIDHTLRSLALARRLGAQHISTEPGGPLEDESQRESAMCTFAEVLKPVLDRAADENVKLLIEPEPGLLIENLDQYLDLRSRLNHPYLGLNYDVGHFYCVSAPLGKTIRRLGPLIDHVHIEDIAPTRVHRHLIPGDGAIDFSEVFTALAEIDYHGWVTIELYPFVDDPDRAGRRAREYLLSPTGNV